MARLTRDEALSELRHCRLQAKAWKDVWRGKFDMPPGLDDYNCHRMMDYYMDRCNKLKQKYFFTEQV